MVQDFFKNLTKMALKTFLDLKIMWQWKVKNLEVVKFHPTKGQLISKANWQAEDSPKKRTNEFVFTTMRRVFVRFLGESSAWLVCFRNLLTFMSFFFFLQSTLEASYTKFFMYIT